MSTAKYGQPYTFSLGLIDSVLRPALKTNPTIALGDFKVSIDGGAFANMATTPTVNPAGSVRVQFTLTGAEMEGANVVVHGEDQTGGEWDDFYYDINPLTQDVIAFTGSSLASVTSMCNMALSHLGVGKEIAALDTDRSQEAAACRRFFEVARDNTLRDYPWPFCTKFQTLALVEEDPNSEWGYSYRYPTDSMKIRRFLSGIRTDNRQSRVSYRISRDDSGLLLFTDKEDAEIEYTMKETDPTRYPADFVMAFSLLLAHYVAPRLTAGDPYKMGERARLLYMEKVTEAQAASSNEEQPDEAPESSFIRSRD